MDLLHIEFWLFTVAKWVAVSIVLTLAVYGAWNLRR